MKEIIIDKALEQYGVVLKAAEILEINPSTLHRKKRRWMTADDEESNS